MRVNVVCRVVLAATLAALGAGSITATSNPGLQLVQYRDAAGRFQFDYPSAFGPPETGTDNGFGGRVAAMAAAVHLSSG